MPKTVLEVAGIGTVYLTKKRGQKAMRLRVDSKGRVQLSMPWLVPRSMALNFVLSKRDWISRQQKSYIFTPYDGMLLGKTLKLVIKENSSFTRVQQTDKKIIIPFKTHYEPSNNLHLQKIKKAIMKALRVEAEKILLPRLRDFAADYRFRYQSASIKQVTGRWGSCDSNRHIVLSLYLIQLPLELIDYVIIHELCHTVQMNHSQKFWSLVERQCPDYKLIRKRMRGLQPRLYDAKEFMA